MSRQDYSHKARKRINRPIGEKIKLAIDSASTITLESDGKCLFVTIEQQTPIDKTSVIASNQGT